MTVVNSSSLKLCPKKFFFVVLERICGLHQAIRSQLVFVPLPSELKNCFFWIVMLDGVRILTAILSGYNKQVV